MLFENCFQTFVLWLFVDLAAVHFDGRLLVEPVAVLVLFRRGLSSPHCGFGILGLFTLVLALKKTTNVKENWNFRTDTFKI